MEYVPQDRARKSGSARYADSRQVEANLGWRTTRSVSDAVRPRESTARLARQVSENKAVNPALGFSLLLYSRRIELNIYPSSRWRPRTRYIFSFANWLSGIILCKRSLEFLLVLHCSERRLHAFGVVLPMLTLDGFRTPAAVVEHRARRALAQPISRVAG